MAIRNDGPTSGPGPGGPGPGGPGPGGKGGPGPGGHHHHGGPGPGGHHHRHHHGGPGPGGPTFIYSGPGPGAAPAQSNQPQQDQQAQMKDAMAEQRQREALVQSGYDVSKLATMTKEQVAQAHTEMVEAQQNQAPSTRL